MRGGCIGVGWGGGGLRVVGKLVGWEGWDEPGSVVLGTRGGWVRWACWGVFARLRERR